MFELDRFIADCRVAIGADPTHKSVREVVACAVADPSAVVAGLGEPARAEVQKLYGCEELTILNVVWGPGMTIMPHNHLMWAVIGIYGGREDNALYRRSETGLIELRAKTLDTKDVIPLGEAVIHSVTNPLEQITAAIHVYGGDFFATPRSEWDPKTFEERPYDVAHAMQVFEESNARLRPIEIAVKRTD